MTLRFSHGYDAFLPPLLRQNLVTFAVLGVLLRPHRDHTINYLRRYFYLLASRIFAIYTYFARCPRQIRLLFGNFRCFCSRSVAAGAPLTFHRDRTLSIAIPFIMPSLGHPQAPGRARA